MEIIVYDNDAQHGAAIYLDGSSSLVVRNDITAASQYGASCIYVFDSDVSIYDNAIHGNEYLAPVVVGASTVLLSNNRFNNNGWADGYSTVRADTSDVTAIGNRFADGGGSLLFFDCTATVRANHFTDCYQLARGGGVDTYDSDADVEFNYFERVGDGAIDWTRSTGNIRRNVIAWSPVRSLDYAARAINIDDGTKPTISNNTFYENDIVDPPYLSAADIQVDAESAPIAGCLFVNFVRVL
jgi:hypothetical protein